jgi:hypothetical protein
MRAGLIVAVLVTSGLAVGVAFAATSSAKDRVLQRSDMPAGAKRVSFGASTGSIKIPRTVRGTAAYSAYKFKNSSKREYVASAAGTVATVRDAHDVFVKLRKDATGSGPFHRLKVPRYGDEQVAFGVAVSAASAGVLLVRSGKVLWEVAVSAVPGFSKAKALGELNKYARKEQARAL